MATLDEIEQRHHQAEKSVVEYEAALRILDLNLRAARQHDYEIIYAMNTLDDGRGGKHRVKSYNEINSEVWKDIKENRGHAAKAWQEWHEGKTRLALAVVEEAHLKNLYFDKKEAIRQRP